MNDKQFKIIAALLLSIIILLAIIFFGHIFDFFAGIFLGVIGFFALAAIYISSLKMDDIIMFAILAAGGSAYCYAFFYAVKIRIRREAEKKQKILSDKAFLDTTVQDAIDYLFDKTITRNGSHLIEIFRKASHIDSNDWRVLYSTYLLGYIYSTETLNAFDIKKAISHYADASNKGMMDATLALGKLYFDGVSVEKNYDLAFEYFSKCKNKFASQSFLYLALILRDRAEKNLNKKLKFQKKAVEYLKKSISSPNPNPLASFKLGVMTYLGEGIEKNYYSAYRLITESNTLHFDAELMYWAEMCFHGHGTEKNYQDALYLAIAANKYGADCKKLIKEITLSASKEQIAYAYYRLSSTFSNQIDLEAEYLYSAHNLGCVDATINLAYLHINGKNKLISIDKGKAYKLLKPLADQSNPYAQALLADFYFKGEVVEHNESIGMELLKNSSDQDHVYAMALLAEKISINNKYITIEAFELYQRAAEKGHGYCCYVVGEAFLNGIYINYNYEKLDYCSKNDEKAFYYLNKGADLQNGECQFLLGMIYFLGNHNDIAADYQKSLQFFKDSAANGSTSSFKYLGIQYDVGLGISKNSERAMYYYFKFLEEFNDEVVHHNIACGYLTGDGVEKNINEAIKYFELAAKQGLKNSILSLAYMYIEDKHVDKDLIKSATWFFVAASLDFNESFEEIKKIKDKISSEGIEKAKKNADQIIDEINLSKSLKSDR